MYIIATCAVVLIILWGAAAIMWYSHRNYNLKLIISSFGPQNLPDGLYEIEKIRYSLSGYSVVTVFNTETFEVFKVPFGKYVPKSFEIKGGDLRVFSFLYDKKKRPIVPVSAQGKTSNRSDPLHIFGDRFCHGQEVRYKRQPAFVCFYPPLNVKAKPGHIIIYTEETGYISVPSDEVTSLY